MPSERTTVAIALGLAVVFAFAAVAPIASYDFFWHLATGRWIAEHHALPIHDPFAVASDRTPWINGEWLFDVVLYEIGGLYAASVLRAIFVGLTFAAAFAFTSWGRTPSSAHPSSAGEGARRHSVLLFTALAFAGACARFDLRPSTIAAGLLVAAIIAAQRNAVAFLVIAILWINIHPSALLIPIIALALRPMLAIPGALALLVNPFGWRAIAAPL